ncbi:hypothetical protein [Roseicella sp. DB1501]|uniref:hypothetical protein n=1 Tax=Roseicella sp. DB1501 TaxID=2730925 RepID=UPI0014931308|nr:hypothetical protein [Roseicella sp. DB1501]NOG70281.1 hypothetical protein [Roseicella sp. DB1501]
MHTSRPIEVEGRFLGVAVTHVSESQAQHWRFVATDPVVEDLDGAAFPSPAEARRVAGLVLARSRRPVGTAG